VINRYENIPLIIWYIDDRKIFIICDASISFQIVFAAAVCLLAASKKPLSSPQGALKKGYMDIHAC
jgi:hypothetical protein